MSHRLIVLLLLSLLTFFGARSACAEVNGYYVGKVFPFLYLGNDGLMTGAAMELVMDMMESVGHPLNVQDFKHISWPRAIEDVETRPGMGLFCLGRTPQREERFKWVGPVAHIKIGLVAKKSSNVVIENEDDLKKYEIGVIRSSSPHLMLQEMGIPSEKMTTLVENGQQIRMLEEGRVTLITQADVAVPHYLRQMGLNVADYEMVHILKELPLFIAYNTQTSDEYINKLQQTLNSLMAGDSGLSRYDIILAKHAGGPPLHNAVSMK